MMMCQFARRASVSAYSLLGSAYLQCLLHRIQRVGYLPAGEVTGALVEAAAAAVVLVGEL